MVGSRPAVVLTPRPPPGTFHRVPQNRVSVRGLPRLSDGVPDEPRPGRPVSAAGAATTDAADRLNAFYDGLAARFGAASPSASGWRSDAVFLRQRALVLDVVGDDPGPLVDLGCGAGLVSLPLVRSGRRVLGVDFNAEACRRARRNGLAAVRGDAFAVPLAGGAADVVLNVGFAQQYGADALGPLLREAARLLRPGGRLVIVWSNPAAPIRRTAAACFRVLDALRGRTTPALFAHDPAEMRAAAARAGLTADRVFAISPLSRRRLRVDGLPASLIGTTFVAVLRLPRPAAARERTAERAGERTVPPAPPARRRAVSSLPAEIGGLD